MLSKALVLHLVNFMSAFYSIAVIVNLVLARVKLSMEICFGLGFFILRPSCTVVLRQLCSMFCFQTCIPGLVDFRLGTRSSALKCCYLQEIF